MVEGEIVDLRDRFVRASYYKNYNSEEEIQEELAVFRKDLAHNLTELKRYLAKKEKSDPRWLTGTGLSFVDFIAYEYLDWYRDFVQPDCFATYPKMADYMRRFHVRRFHV